MSPRSPLKLVRIWQGRGGTVRKRKKERKKEGKKERKKYYLWVGQKGLEQGVAIQEVSQDACLLCIDFICK